MQIRVSSPGSELTESEVERIHRDLEKIDRRLHEWRDVSAQVRVSHNGNPHAFKVALEIDYGRNHLLAVGEDPDVGIAVRDAREDVLRQINDRSRRGHSSFAKGR